MHGVVLTEESNEDWMVPVSVTDAPGPPHNSTIVITWSERDWYWLNFYREWCKLNPTDYATKEVYKNYLKWYRTKGEISN